MEATLQSLHQEMAEIKAVLEAIKRLLLSEGELTPWARRALDKARQEPRESYTRLEDLKAEILAE